MNCICKVCGKVFEANPNWRHAEGICGDDCRLFVRRTAHTKYKTTKKGRASEQRWRKNPIKKEIDKKSMQTPTARAKAVIRSTRALATNPYLQEQKRKRDIEYAKTERGKKVNLRAAAKYRKTEKGVMARKVTKALRRSVSGSFTRDDLVNRFAQYGNKCAHCGSAEHITVDHIVPISRGGTNHIDNIQPLCKSCNSRKGARYVC